MNEPSSEGSTRLTLSLSADRRGTQPTILQRNSLERSPLRIAKPLKPDIDFLKARLSRAFRKSGLDFI
jgi:hypothetical protein